MSNLKGVLYDNLRDILNVDTNIRNSAEQQIKALEVLNDYGIHLTEITLDSNLDLEIRQLAGILLKQFINNNWSKNRDKQEPQIEISPSDKTRIRELLLKALGSETLINVKNESHEKKLRSSIAYAISAIAFSDWPEEWPNLLEILMSYLSSGKHGLIYGTMKVFNEICHEFCDIQIPSIAPYLLPKMYEIFIDTSNFSIGTRDRAVQIFTIISETIALMCDYDKNAITKYLEPILPKFTEALLKTLQAPNDSAEVDIHLKKSVLNSLSILIKNCKKKMWDWMPSILTPVWTIMIQSASSYVNTVVNSEVDSEESEPLKRLLLALFEFVTVLIDSSKTRKLIKNSIKDLLYYILVYMQITDEQIEIWESCPSSFIVYEDEIFFSYTVRISALEIILNFLKEIEEVDKDKHQFQLDFLEAIKKHIEESTQAKHSGNSNWWKQLEACLFALGSLSTNLITLIEDSNNPLSIEYQKVLDHVFSFRDEPSIFYTGRFIWTTSRFVPIMSPYVIEEFLKITVNSLKHENSIIQISALKATFNFCVHLADLQLEDIIKPYFPYMFDVLNNMAKTNQNEFLVLIMETIYIMLGLDQEFTLNAVDKVCSLTISVFVKQHEDPTMVIKITEIFSRIAKDPRCYKYLEESLLPIISQILTLNQDDKKMSILKPVTLEILKILVRNSPSPLSNSLIHHCFPLACHNILSTSDDTSVMQEGGECIRAYVSKSAKQIANFQDSQSGQSGLSLVMQVCLHLLNPSVNESCATFVGKLVFVTINKGAIFLGSDNVHLLLRSVLSKLQTSQSLVVTQSLIMVFAHLLNHSLNTVLDFLSQLPGPSGSHSALEFVLLQWLSRQHLFFGEYETKVAVMALCELLEHSIVANNNSKINLNQIIMPGEPIISVNSGVKTRSRTLTNPDQWTSIPCSVKILKLLIHELNHRETSDTFEDEEDSDDEEDENGWNNNLQEDNNFNNSINNNVNFDDINEENEEEDDDDTDQDILDDPISKINLKGYLAVFLTHFMINPCSKEFLPQLNEKERSILEELLKR